MLTFFFKIVTLRKKTIDNSISYIPQSEKAEEGNIKPNTIKVGSLPRKQDKNISQNNENFLKNKATQGFGYLK